MTPGELIILQDPIEWRIYQADRIIVLQELAKGNKRDLIKVLGNEAQFGVWIERFFLPEKLIEESPASRIHAIAKRQLESLPKRRPKYVLTSVGRLVSQKASLLFEAMADGRTALEHVLADLGGQGIVIVLGSGESEFENRMAEIAERETKLLFLCGYSETLAAPLYRSGDLFLMPSSFEPCGISQMLAMRGAQPCVVHGVGGLKDTVDDGQTGFVFDGETTREQAENFVASVRHALAIKTRDGKRWRSIGIRAASMRFSWSVSALQTIEKLYVGD